MQRVKHSRVPVQFTKRSEDLEAMFEEGMRADIVKIIETQDDCYKVSLDVAPYESLNKSLMTPSYYNKEDVPCLTVIETSFYPEDGIEVIYIDKRDHPFMYFTLIEDNGLFAEYMKTNSDSSVSYIQWLENQVLSSRNTK